MEVGLKRVKKTKVGFLKYAKYNLFFHLDKAIFRVKPNPYISLLNAIRLAKCSLQAEKPAAH